MLNENLFVYGTLKDPKIQLMVLGRTVRGTWDRLADFKKSTIQLDDRYFPTVKPAKGSSVEGMVIAISPTELKQIDRYEGPVYRRKKETLASGRQAWVYRT